ncbi:MAG: thioredoxin-related protein [Alphaproteobacteria bacterium]|jgi:thioredoxin-related protein
MAYSAFGINVLALFSLVLGPDTLATSADDSDRLQNLKSLNETSAIAKRLNVPIVLLTEQRDCAFCQRLKRDVFRPLANDPSYFDKVLFASVLTDFDGPLIEKDETKISGFKFAESLDANTTPTVLLLDHSSN